MGVNFITNAGRIISPLSDNVTVRVSAFDSNRRPPPLAVFLISSRFSEQWRRRGIKRAGLADLAGAAVSSKYAPMSALCGSGIVGSGGISKGEYDVGDGINRMGGQRVGKVGQRMVRPGTFVSFFCCCNCARVCALPKRRSLPRYTKLRQHHH